MVRGLPLPFISKAVHRVELFLCLKGRPSMVLVANWRRVRSRAWSVRLIAMTFALIALDVALPAFEKGFGLPSRTFAVLSGLC
jgi:hypothetical protein